MVEGLTRATGLKSLAQELGFENLSNVIKLGTDSNAAEIFKIPGDQKPVDLMMILGFNEIDQRPRGLS
eukprot:7062487-Karenia_brevis.AAC.1